ncbi:1d041f54-115d-4e15-90a1-b00bd05db96a [Sclerotinia trifoliorum]|uniref:Dipeptidase n=1 Tax=Sclerotinia trifoliorum TaxID=28548 RepID=A0A8H2VX51_9HELO|nr:1d041f54-115d-4e15-90a1-b00bd05db96a [Sclerotinia trifoliorum]
MPYTEQDPLLSTDKSSAEIKCSSHQNINADDPDNPEDTRNGCFEPTTGRGKRSFNDLMAGVLGLCSLLILTMLILPGGFVNDTFDHGWPFGSQEPKTVEQRVDRILTETPLIDGHNDLAIFIRSVYKNRIYDESFTNVFENGGMPYHVDLPRLKAGKNGGAFWSAFAPCPSNWSDFSTENYGHSVAYTLSQLDLLARLQAAYPSYFALPGNSSTALSAFKNGQLISPYIIEGLHQIGNSISNLRQYYNLGVRYATLTHNCHNRYADAALVELPGGDIEKSTPHWGGVSPAGRQLIHEMNRLGMIVDLSHTSQDTMRSVLGLEADWPGSLAPVIFSHSSAYAICPHPRNVPDDILQLVKKTNSLVMVNFAPDFVSCVANSSNTNGLPDFYPNNSTLEHVARHVMHIGDLIGYDHVGFGSDFDGIENTPEGLDDVSKYPDLVAELLKQGVSDKDAAKVVGGNILRVWKDVDEVAAHLQAKGEKPLEDDLALMA